MSTVPEVVFITPYRDREAHLNCFLQTMKFLLSEISSEINYEFVISEQGDNREFNRGAMKNMGFMYIKRKYPHHYKNITFVFNDVDTFPGVKGIVDKYFVKDSNVVKHFYGFDFALGGVFSIKGEVFEKINGFPNYWGWGLEDNCLQKRLVRSGYNVNRSYFDKFNDSKWINLFHGFKRKVDTNVVSKFNNDNSLKNGISSIKYNVNSILQKSIDTSINAYIVTFSKWDIPEEVSKIKFEINDNPTRLFQKNNKNNTRFLLRYS